MSITITSKAASLYACGVVHPKGARSYPDDWFTPGQVAELQNHPDLTVGPIDARRTATRKASTKKAAAKRS